MQPADATGGLVQTLNELLSKEPYATFHDATVVDLQHDAEAGRASLAADLCVGDPDASTVVERERRRRGRLTLEGVRLWRADGGDPTVSAPSRWLTAEGPLAESTTELGRTLYRDSVTEPYCWYFYFSDTNSFLYWTARHVAFAWEGSTRP
jgi:hypothetical protein